MSFNHRHLSFTQNLDGPTLEYMRQNRINGVVGAKDTRLPIIFNNKSASVSSDFTHKNY